jgi:hypothetical protein
MQFLAISGAGDEWRATARPASDRGTRVARQPTFRVFRPPCSNFKSDFEYFEYLSAQVTVPVCQLFFEIRYLIV